MSEQSVNASSSNVFHVVYENIVSNTSFWLEKLCDFFEFKYTKDSIDEAVSETTLTGSRKFQNGYARGETGHAVLQIDDHMRKKAMNYLEETLDQNLFQEIVLRYI